MANHYRKELTLICLRRDYDMREGGGGSSSLTLHNHIDILKTAISQGCDVRLILDDGELTASSAVLATFSGWLRQLLLEAVHSNTWLDEVPLLW